MKTWDQPRAWTFLASATNKRKRSWNGARPWPTSSGDSNLQATPLSAPLKGKVELPPNPESNLVKAQLTWKRRKKPVIRSPWPFPLLQPCQWVVVMGTRLLVWKTSETPVLWTRYCNAFSQLRPLQNISWRSSVVSRNSDPAVWPRVTMTYSGKPENPVEE